jgi:tRNA modification GTPase
MLSSRNAAIRKLWRGRRFATGVVPSPTEKKTIYALSTPPGRGGIGVIRVSGPDALDVYSQMVRVRAGGGAKGKQKEVVPEPWKMRRCSIVHPESQEVLDEGMTVFFQGPSFASCRYHLLF